MKITRVKNIHVIYTGIILKRVTKSLKKCGSFDLSLVFFKYVDKPNLSQMIYIFLE